MSDFIKLVGEKIRIIRKRRGMTQEELAEKANLQYTYIGGVERGERNISLETLEKIAEGLAVKPNSLLEFQEIDIQNEHLNKNNLLEIHLSLVKNRSDDEIKLIHKTVQDILLLLDSKN